MRDKYGSAHDNYCYSGTDVLINKLNIQSSSELSEAETAFTALRYQAYVSDVSVIEDFNLVHLQRLHFLLFQDIYVWAGKLRTIDISKGNTRFCTYSRIELEASKLFKEIPTLVDLPLGEPLIMKLATLFCELNVVHPFREGNGRTQRFFFEELMHFIGYEIVWPDISNQRWIDANIRGYRGDLRGLSAIIQDAIT